MDFCDVIPLVLVHVCLYVKLNVSIYKPFLSNAIHKDKWKRDINSKSVNARVIYLNPLSSNSYHG